MSAKLSRKQVVAVYVEVRGTVKTSATVKTRLDSSAFDALSANLLASAYIKFISGRNKGKEIRVSSFTSAAVYPQSALDYSAQAGDEFVVSPAVGAASLRKYVYAGEASVDFDPTMLERNVYTSSLDKPAAVNGRNIANFSFESEVKGSGTAGTSAEYRGLLMAANMTEADAATVVYTVNSLTGVSTQSVTIRIYKDGQKHEARYCRVAPMIKWKAGEYGTWTWAIKGVWQTPAAATNPSASYDATNPIKIQRCALVINGSVHPVISEFTLDLGNELTVVDDAESPEGVLDIEVTNRDPRGTMTIQAPAQTFYDVYTKLTANTLESLAITLGTTAGNIVQISCPKIQILNAPLSDNNGILTMTVEFAARVNSADDSVVITTC